MKKYIFLFPLFLLFFGMPRHLWSQANRKPNIIVFLVDDMGWQDTSVPFWTSKTPLNEKYHTPNMERLAGQGMKFTNAHATSVCTPTRVSMLTGMNAAHHKVTNWTSPKANNSTDYPDEQFDPADWNFNGLSPAPGVNHTIHATPLPELLKQAGYYTIHVGKAHFGSTGTPGADPHNLGFTVNIAGHAAGHPQSYLGEKNYGNIPGKSNWQAVPGLEEYHGKNIFLTEALTRKAIKAIEKPIREERPFFLNMAHYAVHTPLDKDERFYKKYIAAGLDDKEARYAALIEGMDKSLGDLMDYLKARKIEDNTVIIFMSDNGGLSRVPPRGGIPHTQNLPLKAGKGSLYEGGIRVPMIVKWKGKIKAGTTTSYGVIIEDYFPTILEIAGVSSPKTVQEIDGKSFVHMLKNPALVDTTRTFIWHTPNKWIPENGPGINYKSAIRQGAWKLIYNMRDKSAELYNLHQDLEETTDLAEQYPEKATQLAALLSKQLREWEAAMPLIKNSDRPAPFPSVPAN